MFPGMVFHFSPNMKSARNPMFSWVENYIASKYILKHFIPWQSPLASYMRSFRRSPRELFLLLRGTKIYPSHCKYESLFKSKTEQTAGLRMWFSPGGEPLLIQNWPQVPLSLTQPSQRVHGHKILLVLCLSTVYESLVSQFNLFPLLSCLENLCKALFHIYLCF